MTTRMFDSIAPRYDLLNRLISFGLDQKWRREVAHLLHLPPGAMVLDVASGTGDLSLAVRRRWPGCVTVGVDPAFRMLSMARKKDPKALLIRGDGLHLPFREGTFHAAVIAFGIRNFPDRLKGLWEMQRVVKSGGKVVVLELTRPEGRLSGLLHGLYLSLVVPGMGALLSRGEAYAYLRDSIRAFPSPSEFVKLMGMAGLTNLHSRPLFLGTATIFAGSR